jgi:hypothetical protein
LQISDLKGVCKLFDLGWRLFRMLAMKRNPILLVALALYALTCSAQQTGRYVTLISTNGNFVPMQMQILDGETAEIQDAHASIGGVSAAPITVAIQKSGITVRGYPQGYQYGSVGLMSRGSVVAGPATIGLDSGSPGQPTLLTVKIYPDTYDVNKTLLLPPGTNQVYVGMESSTNLVNWADATNGMYGGPDTVRFFRIKMQKP